MMYIQDGEDRNINTFIFVSLIIHAILFLTYPQWSSFLISETPGLENGGVIQIISLDTSSNRDLSSATDRTSESLAPRTTDPRPNPDPPRAQTATEVVVDREEVVTPKPIPRPEPVVQPEVIVTPPPQPRPVPEDPTPSPGPLPAEPTTIVAPQPEPIPEARPIPSQLITSETGIEIIVEAPIDVVVIAPEPIPEPEPIPKPEPIPEPIPIPKPQPEPVIQPETPVSTQHESSASGVESIGEDDASDPSASDSGEGTEEVVPPLPPPPSGRSLHAGGGSPIYPKNAEDEGAEGTVQIEVTVSATGQTLKVVVVGSSNDIRLDQQAQRTIEQLWRFTSAAEDYVLVLDVEFARIVIDGVVQFQVDVHFGDVRWVDAM